MTEKHYCESCHYFKSYSFDEMDCDSWCTKNPDDETNNGVFKVLDPVKCENYKKKGDCDMNEKRYVLFNHNDTDYILDTPSTDLDFIEMLGDALSSEEIVDRLNKQDAEIKGYKKVLHEYIQSNPLIALNHLLKQADSNNGD